MGQVAKQEIKQTLLTEEKLKNPEWQFLNNYLLPHGLFDDLILEQIGLHSSTIKEVGYYLYPKADEKGIIRATCLYRSGNLQTFLKYQTHPSEIEFFTGQVCAVYVRFKRKKS